MNLDHLYYFRTLVELKSRNRAAERLSITPSTLSLAISKLEREVGVPLIEKKRGSVDLTSDGQAFYEYVATALSFLDGGLRVLRERHGGGFKARSPLEPCFQFKTKSGRASLPATAPRCMAVCA